MSFQEVADKILISKAKDGGHADLGRLHSFLTVSRKQLTITVELLAVFPRFLSGHRLLQATSLLPQDSIPVLDTDSPFCDAFMLLNMVGEGLDSRQLHPDVAASISNLFPSMVPWIILFLELTPNIELPAANAVGDAFLKLLLHVDEHIQTSTLQSSRALIPALLDAWIYLSTLRFQHPYQRVGQHHVLIISHLIGIFRQADASFSERLRIAASTRFESLCASLTRDLSALPRSIGEPEELMSARLGLSLLVILLDMYSVHSVRRRLATLGICPILCRMLHKASRLEVELIDTDSRTFFPNLIGAITMFLCGPPERTVIPSLREKLLPSILRMQDIAYEWAKPHHSADWHRFSREIEFRTVRLLKLLGAFLVFESCHEAFQKSVRYIDVLASNLSIRPSGEIWQTFLDLRSRLERHTAESSSWRANVICTNNSCNIKYVSREVGLLPERGKRCTGCGIAEYCSESCRRIHWRVGGHRYYCTAIRENRRAGLSIGPFCPRDMDLIYGIIERYFRSNMQRITMKLVTQVYREYRILPDDPLMATMANNFVVVFTFPSSANDTSPDFYVELLTEFCKDLDEDSMEIGVDGLIQRRKLQLEAYVAIMVDSTLVDLTNFWCIKKHFYTVEPYT